MSTDNETIKEINAILKWINLAEDVKDFYLKTGDIEISLSRNNTSTLFLSPKTQAAPDIAASTSAPATVSKPQAIPAPVASAPDVSSKQPSLELGEDEIFIKAPMVGTFYASPKPGAPAFVKVGDKVKSDTVLCIVEVMKLMNNIEAKVDGVVSKILVENEQPVEYGQPLMIIKTK
ncbi:acetyl-CoA carboxylase biotin carboxyl carrier protein [uncultured Bartonella sp.]|uniref:acetyl-CoA carboxylase biotin carboxyl carrier protein n=1 Tax=uncultured Bartonella sp. TaxID=104108 RepID=UPI00261ABDE8|nr:acetyl-CoA carboxylase biotin carboxyl carrier protein [uncultured Bartonella sp.]